MDTLTEFKRLSDELNRVSGENAALRAMAWPQFAPVGSKQEKFGFMGRIENDSPGFQLPPLARQYGFMDNTIPGFPNPTLQHRYGFMDTQTMSTFTDGLATGVGFGVGLGIAGILAAGILYILKRK